ncbi:MAG: TAT-variant-translocated molybdopterin oxidoreductase [Acidobacteriota bacterium]|nr:TAT-variant-translocated molybdopterin oxidoreductase [Blastocatellia bacterium]MDW8413009.1 TAT-variant-translocated molybdopterin oxidoreductase [Acidobacteriota bacterium]
MPILGEQLVGQEGQRYWRSLDELADRPEFREYVEREFPEHASEMSDPISRRKFLFLMAASLSFAGFVACRRPVHEILPAAATNVEYVPGVPMYYATVVTRGGYAQGLLVRSNDGRPTKVEGNPLHPASLGATDVYAQASILELYDPDRSQVVKKGGSVSSWKDFVAFALPHFAALKSKSGAGLRVLSEKVSSPTLAMMRKRLLEEMPQAKWVEYEPINLDNMLEGTKIAFGQPLHVHCAYDRADVVVSLGSDFLCTGYGSVANLKAYSKRRRVEPGREIDLNRLYVVESNFSITGAKADHRLRLRSGEIASFASALAGEVFNLAGGDEFKPLVERLGKAGNFGKWVQAVAKDLVAHKGKSVVVVGEAQPAAVHALACVINRALGNEGATVRYTAAFNEQFVRMTQALAELAKEIDQGLVDTLLILGGNPVYNAPVELDFATKLKKVPTSIRLGLYEDETTEVSKWHINEAHYLEAWGDARSYDGTASIQQPLIEPLYGGKSAIEVVSVVLGAEKGGYDLVKSYWQSRFGADSEKLWKKSLSDGVIGGTAFAEVRPGTLQVAAVSEAIGAASRSGLGELELNFIPCASVWDGRYSNNGWLQELPDPMTKLTWGNALLVSVATARAKGLESGDIVKVSAGGRTIEAAVWIQPGHADGSATIALGYGRNKVGRIGRGVGHNGYLLRTAENFYTAGSISITKTGQKLAMASTQEHHSMEGRPVVREATVTEYVKNPKLIEQMEEVPPLKSAYRNPLMNGEYQWGMAIDLNSCVGCNACVVACQAENNVPIVGKQQVLRSREMHWIRVDRYYVGDENDPRAVHQPINCQQCENAPCEPVCPVAATVHSPEGLNDMAYNRCIGTRYCANNCPYKVRRFNFLNYHKDLSEVEKLAFNPEVTVRARGVMEKCTYCIQRIQAARVQAKSEDRRRIRDGEIRTACQQVCPADAIVFGDLADPASQVSRLKAEPRNYVMLAELNIKPRTSYLARLRNPNPELG